MRRMLMIVGLAAAVAAPSLANAESCQAHAHDRKVVGTVVGAGGGALIGNAVSHNTTGTLLGAAGGALVGNQIAREKCGDSHDYHRAHYERHHGHHDHDEHHEHDD